MLLISYEHYEHFYYKFINSTYLINSELCYLINSELWTVPYNDMTMTWTITPLVSLNCSTVAAAAIASGRETYMVCECWDVSVAASTSWLLCIAIILSLPRLLFE